MALILGICLFTVKLLPDIRLSLFVSKKKGREIILLLSENKGILILDERLVYIQ